MSDRSDVRVLVTGAGGPAGVAVLRSLARRPEVTLMAADMDRVDPADVLAERTG